MFNIFKKNKDKDAEKNEEEKNQEQNNEQNEEKSENIDGDEKNENIEEDNNKKLAEDENENIEENKNNDLDEAEVETAEILEEDEDSSKGLFGRLKEGLSKTRDSFVSKISSIFSRTNIDDELYEELEETLIQADVGVRTTMELIDKMKDEVEEKDITEPEENIKVNKELKNLEGNIKKRAKKERQKKGLQSQHQKQGKKIDETDPKGRGRW